MWQLLHSKPAFEWVLWAKVSPPSLWQFVHNSVTVAAFGFWACGSWQLWQSIPAEPCLLDIHSSVVVLWQVPHSLASGVTDMGAMGCSGSRGPWQLSQVTPSKAY